MNPNLFGDISVIDKDATMTDHFASPTMTLNLGTEQALDYEKTHKKDVQSAEKRRKRLWGEKNWKKTTLTKLLSSKGVRYSIPNYALPKVFKKKSIERGEKINIGGTDATVLQELGRGAFGVVVLMEIKNGPNLAVKASINDSDTLAWEYEVLQKIEERINPKQFGSSPFPYPKPLSCLKLADGGMFCMTAASDSGLNLVDIVNLYKYKLGENVPELVVLHYTVKMLDLIERLHWHGKILVRTYFWCQTNLQNGLRIGHKSSLSNPFEPIVRTFT